jgi:NAD(P)H-dependent flavin oxidoreductase YrpB (nitropropane dioxygenase family)
MNTPLRVGGMGVYNSTPTLVRKCSRANVAATVTIVGAECVLARILQIGDPGGDYRRALNAFPFPDVAEWILEKYFVEGGIDRTKNFRSVPPFSLHPNPHLQELTVAAAFAVVWLAKENNPYPIAVNCLEKMQLHLPYYMAGAMLAGVDFVTMGAGLPHRIPPLLQALSQGSTGRYPVFVHGGKEESVYLDPSNFGGRKFPAMKCPGFIPIVSSNVLTDFLVKELPGCIQGIVIEDHSAGGHSPSPRGARGKALLSERGEPIYGPRDEVNFAKIKDHGIPFWIGGSYASPEALSKARSLGADGIQVGSIFALCDDSGNDPVWRNEMRRLGYRGELDILNDAKASPTGFPFKVVQLEGTLSSSHVYGARIRTCDLGALRTPYRCPDGHVGYRCQAEPEDEFIRKGGNPDLTAGARCICNGLFAGVGLGSPGAPPIFTLGKRYDFLLHLMEHENDSYTAEDAIAYLLS